MNLILRENRFGDSSGNPHNIVNVRFFLFFELTRRKVNKRDDTRQRKQLTVVKVKVNNNIKEKFFNFIHISSIDTYL